MDACKIVKGLEPKFGNFTTKEAVLPDAPTKQEEEEVKVVQTKKDPKKETTCFSNFCIRSSYDSQRGHTLPALHC